MLFDIYVNGCDRVSRRVLNYCFFIKPSGCPISTERCGRRDCAVELPCLIALGPLVAAIAAGNRVMIKLPEITPATITVLRRMLAEVFTEDEVCIFGEEILDPAQFTSLPFNHIVFTGSPAIGQ